MIPVILSGGSGTRLWPVSRQSLPKQFCELFDESLLEKTLRRLQPLGSPWVITLVGMKVLTERVLKNCGIPSSQVLYEPIARNTAPAIALLCKVLESKGQSDEVVGIFPADHFIENVPEFQRLLAEAVNVAKTGFVVTLGIHPTFPSTGYGYIETRNEKTSGILARPALSFREKPALKLAEEYVASGNFFWNAGIFVFRVKDMIEGLKSGCPDIWEGLESLKPDLSNLGAIYPTLKSVSIDYAVMEKLRKQKCIPANVGWNDVGSWDEVSQLASNTDVGVLIEVKAKSNFVHPFRDKKYGVVGVDDLIIVDTADALLIAKKGETQEVKAVVERLQSQGSSVATQHPFEIRPWGSFEILRDTPGFKSKVIRVDAGQQLSYQSHSKRAEHWVIISGDPEVVLNDKVLRPRPGEAVFIPQGSKHRMRNVGKSVVEFVEVQVGSYFGEDDIVRYQDDYHRV
jgi:mannose-1-phosphate guanylyltransferase/mannose-1-phosphate guanylyltransferase/mannose-6-phosphate isomerase